MSASSCQAWVFANRDAKGYYRVAYTPEGLKKIAQIAEKQLNVPERIAFLEDAWAMTRATKTSAVDFLAVSQALRGEQNRHVMDLLGTHLRYLKDSAVSADRQQKFDHFVQVQFGALAKKLGWNPLPSDTDDQKALRASLLETLGAAGDQEAVAVARHIVEQYMENPTSVEGTISGPAFAIAAANGSPALYDRFLQALSSSKSSDEYYHYLYALADFALAAGEDHGGLFCDELFGVGIDEGLIESAPAVGGAGVGGGGDAVEAEVDPGHADVVARQGRHRRDARHGVAVGGCGDRGGGRGAVLAGERDDDPPAAGLAVSLRGS